ncbi:Exocyst complex component SEC8 [Linum perenne]
MNNIQLGQSNMRAAKQVGEKGKTLATFADDYRKLAIDCLKVLGVEKQLETIFHLQEMTNREYLEDQDAEEPDDFIISLTAQITRWDEEMAHFVSPVKRNYIFGGICSIASSASIKVLADLKSINLFGVQQMCRNSIALEQPLAAIPSINSEAVLDRVRTYYELLNMPFEARQLYSSFACFHRGACTLIYTCRVWKSVEGEGPRKGDTRGCASLNSGRLITIAYSPPLSLMKLLPSSQPSHSMSCVEK